MQAAGFVLVGGRSSRMGHDKAFLMWNSRPLIEDTAAKVASITGNVALIGRPELYRDLGFDCLPDLQPGLGPLAGIETALSSGRGKSNLILACDMPGLKSEWLSRLMAKARETRALCVAARDENGAIHPLCGVYSSGCLATVRNALASGRLKLMDLLRELDAVILDIPAAISNVNTPEEWNSVSAGNDN